MSFSWIVSQIGARQHYGVPRGFYYNSELRLLYTDAWCRTGRSLLRRGPQRARALAGRYHPDIPNPLVVSFNLQTMRRLIRDPEPDSNATEKHQHYLRFGKWFSTKVARDLSRRRLDPQKDAFFGFNTGCLETMKMLADRGVVTVVDQIDPARVEEQMIFDEAERWPGWQKLPGRVPSAYWERMDAEWSAASIVLVNSAWSRKALVQQGVPAGKIVIIPPPYEPEKIRLPARNNMDKPLTVLWLGLVNLRKGIQYLIEAARLLEHHSQTRFIVAGPIQISDQALKTAPGNMQFLGRVTRTETGPLYRAADLFVLPTLSDGFAVSQLEAMSQALPVIATPNCGEVVTHGQDGLIVPPCDGQAIAKAVQSLDDDRQLLRQMSYRAIGTSTKYYLPRQAMMIEEAIGNQRQGLPLDQGWQQPLPGRPQMLSQTPVRLSQSATPSLRVVVIQDGARLHYAVPLALHRAGVLRLMFSEGFLRRGTNAKLLTAMGARFSQKRVRAFLQRRADEIPPQMVRTNALLAVKQQMARGRHPTDESFYEWSSRAVGDWVLKRGLGDCNTLFGFIRNIDPRLCREYRNRGVRTIADQIIAPAAIEAAEAAIQIQRWPDWHHAGPQADLKLVEQVEQATWRQLDRITCGSTYVREGLMAQGIEGERIHVLPYPIDLTRYPKSKDKPDRSTDQPFTVGFVGMVGLRKGAPYFLEVARRFKGSSVRFVMVGSVYLPDPIKKLMGESIELVGRVTRDQTAEWLLKFDALLFPSTCEGNATSVTEAMASGLPIIASPNSGTPVRDGIEGFIRDYSDIDGMASCIENLASNSGLRSEMGVAARAAAQGLSLEGYGKKLVQVMSEIER